ncbi:MAG: RagB/SusD family nutrient uptake outer membrane protein [Cytophagales bacterium]|nr:RagB/SusD family nutrient uptake outer membrane protein [Cytophagales bacterium]
MKKITIIAILGVTLVNYSCDTDAFLTETNPNALNADFFWENAVQVEQGLSATYGTLQFTGVMGSAAVSQLPVRSDVGRPNNWNANARSLQNLEFNDNTEIVRFKWENTYEGIYRANQVLENLDPVEDLERRVVIEAEARFLRGLNYYFLYQGYNNGSVILHTSTPKTQEDFNKAAAPAEEVFQVILGDLEFARQHLPETWNTSNVGRATWGAATAMLGKLWINEREYETAKGYFKEIIDRPDLYSLTPEIGWNFDEEHEWNSESIFEVAFSSALKPGNAGQATDGPTGSEGTGRTYALGPVPSGGFRVIMPSYWITMLYKADSMDLTDPRYDEDDVYSLRTSVSIAIADDTGTTLYQKPSNEGGIYNNSEASYVKKFQNWLLEREPLETNNSGINERLIRLADIYLLYAETLLQTGGSYTEALGYVNQVRDRGGVVELNEAEYDATSLMEHIMWVERPLELMFEGHDMRWVDLRRWGRIKEQFDRLAAMKFTLDGQNIRWYEEGDEDIEGLKVVQELIEAANAYSPALHDYFPIPVTEQQTNPNFNGTGN